MGAIKGDITIRTSEMRPCLAGIKKALFHRWSDNAKVVAPGNAIGSFPGGQISYTVAIVELENGKIEEFSPDYITFLDNAFQQYVFPDDLKGGDK